MPRPACRVGVRQLKTWKYSESDDFLLHSSWMLKVQAEAIGLAKEGLPLRSALALFDQAEMSAKSCAAPGVFDHLKSC
jgi:hypothetical protein